MTAGTHEPDHEGQKEQDEIRARIQHGLVYTETQASFLAADRRASLIFAYNQTDPTDARRRTALLQQIFGSVGADPVVYSPLNAAYGSNVHIGDRFFGNANITFVDDVEIRIGHDVMIAPNVTITTTGHPVHPERRRDFGRFSEPIHIEDKVWIGANAVILPGVRIGYGSVIGAGSVVSHDIPALVVAVGVPCRVVRPITDADLTTRDSLL